MKKIVALPGGGGFCLIQSILLSHVDVSDVDVFVGTSGGSANAAYLAAGFDSSKLADMYMEFGIKSFDQSLWRRMVPLLCDHSDRNLNSGLKNTFGQTTLLELKKKLIVPTIDFKHRKPKVFDNINHRDDMDVPVWEVVRMSSSAPTYFPMYKGHIDGGLWANDPSMVGALTLSNQNFAKFKDMKIFTIGSGSTPYDSSWDLNRLRRWSKWKHHWVRSLVDGLTGWNEKSTMFGCNALGLGWYKKYDPILIEDDWAMNDPKVMLKLDKMVKDNSIVDHFKQLWDEFMS